MSLNSIYIASNLLALIGWLALFVSVFLSVKVSWIAARVLPVALAFIYTVLMFSILPFAGGGFGSLAELSKLFAQPSIALVGWIHYLAFDLFIGAWQVQTAKRQKLPNALVLPALVLTLIMGPLGLLFFLTGRYLLQSRSALPRSIVQNIEETPKPSLDPSKS